MKEGMRERGRDDGNRNGANKWWRDRRDGSVKGMSRGNVLRPLRDKMEK